ncbi:short-chain dehydrogenase/reductase family protein [Favolaschia claudopus]|uniref:Short-chain dehydrogenase/reductase family protein n=1 Tax=Favolaschia claudopus TaxID=2862362 RepID=A0AAW0ALZ9_9AGAR
MSDVDFPAFSAKTTAQDAASALTEQIRGKTVLITGTSIGGIGFEAARVLARYAGLVIISGYDRERLKLSAAAIEKEFPSANIPIFTNMNQKGQDKLDLISMGALTAEGLPDETKFTWKTMAEGAATTIVAAFDPRLDSKSGAYLDDCVEANEKVAPHTANPDTASKLWEIAESIVGEKFAF